MLPLVLFLVSFVPMLLEARRSRMNERALRASGAIEPAGDVWGAMQVAYPASFAAMILEAGLRGRGMSQWVIAGALVFGAAKALKYWAIVSLGPRWSFRVLVLPGSALVSGGPYRLLHHPNYVGVMGELAGMALLAQAPVAGTISFAVFTALILTRIRVEERALGLATKRGM